MKTRLRVLRAELEWSQAELAKHVGVARATIVSIETRRYDPGLALAFKIARIFGKTIEEYSSTNRRTLVWLGPRRLWRILGQHLT